MKSTYIYGLHAISALLNTSPGRIQAIFIQQGRTDARIANIIDHAQRANIAITRVPRQILDEKAQHASHQGAIAQVHSEMMYTEADLTTLLDQLTEPPFLLILDGVQDPHNLGACLRTANCAGVHAVIIPKDKAVALTATVHKVAAGAAGIIPLIQITNLARTLRELQSRGIWIYGAAGTATQSIYDTDLTGPLALVLGAEGSGMRRLTKEHCDQLFSIPMFGTVESLNVSVAGAVCLYEAVRQKLFITTKS